VNKKSIVEVYGSAGAVVMI